MLELTLSKMLHRAKPKRFSLDTMQVGVSQYKGAGTGATGRVNVFFGPDIDHAREERLSIDVNPEEARVLAFRIVEEADKAEGRTPLLCKLQDELDEIAVGLRGLFVTREQAEKSAQRALDMIAAHVASKGRE